MTASERPSTAVSVLSGFIALGALPLGVVLFGLVTEELASALNEGGPGMYALLAVAALATVAGAVGVFLAARGNFGVWAGSALLAPVLMAVGTLAYGNAVTGTFKAIAHASPLDRPLIMRGGVGECNQLLVLAAALAAGLFVMQGLAMIVAGFAAKASALRKSLLLLGLGLLAIGAWQAFSARATSGERDALRAMAHAAPLDRLTLVVDGFERMASSRQLSLFPLLAALALAVVAAVVLRADRRLAAGVLFGILVPLVGVGGARATARLDPEVQEMLVKPEFAQELLSLDGPPSDTRFTRLSVGTQLTDGYGEGGAPELDSLAGREVGLLLEAGVTREALLKALQQLRAAGVSSLTLVGTQKTPPPPSVPANWAVLFDEPRALPLALLSPRDCGEGCQRATLTEQSLSWGAETWPLKRSSFFPAYDLKPIPLGAEGVSLESLLAACHTVGGQGAMIALVLPE
jgi:hypothetical protein